MDTVKRSLVRLVSVSMAVGLSALLLACGGGGDSGGDGGSQPPPANVAGTWSVSESGTSSCTGEATYSENYQVTVAQSGSALTVTTPVGTFNGSISGSTVTWSGSYPEDGGTTTITGLSVTVAADTNSFSGSSSWTWSGSGTACSGTSSSVIGTRVGGSVPNAPSGLGASALSSSSIRLTWSDNSGNETGFRIERATAQSGPFSEIASVAANVTTFDSTGLASATTYFYRVRASGSAGNSPFSNVASATTSAAGLVAPSGLTATAASASAINLAWTDNSSNETGFKIERGTNATNFTQIAVASAGSTTFANNTGLSAGTTYFYRVRATNASGDSAYSNTAQATTTGTGSFSLTLTGVGTGSLVTSSPAGISCSPTCVATYAGGTSVTLTAGAVTSATFTWGGCDSTTATTCTVAMNANRTVTLSTTLAVATITMSVPATSSTGTYTVSWTASGGLISTPWTLQESPNTSFTSVTTFIVDDNTSPYTRNFTSKADGTYCYRVVISSTPSAPACITVARPTTAVLRLTNNTRYDMIDIRLNGTQRVNYPNALLAGNSADFVFTSPGTVTYNLGVGFYNPNTTKDIWFTLTGSTSVTAGNTTSLSFNNPTIGQLLSGFRSNLSWDGLYFTGTGIAHTATLNFSSGGGWTLFDDGAQIGTGTVQLVSWPNYSPIVTFRLCSTCPSTQIAYPFASFLMQNGPASWPIIEYVRRP